MVLLKLFINKKEKERREKDLERQMNNLGLTEEEKEKVRKGKYVPWTSSIEDVDKDKSKVKK